VTKLIKTMKQWEIFSPSEQEVQALATELNISTIAAKICLARNIKTKEQADALFTLNKQDFHDPFLLYGMDEAVARIEEAIFNEEKILIYGDYDADGITSTTVLYKALFMMGAEHVSYVIPNRFEHGYGPNEQLFREAHANGVQLIITVDNGISGFEPIRIAKELGMDVIVTDHHEASETLPEADIIIHPRVPEGHYPFGELAGVGVAFKLAHALLGEVPEELFEYVAIGTIADLVPLVGENRYLVKQGIKYLKASPNPWVRALCQISGATQKEINEETIGFYFGPRLNAIGRLGDAMPGVEFLLSEDTESATIFAKQLNEKNQERKGIVDDITKQAIEQIESNEQMKQALVHVVTGEGWNAGVVGIVASRIVEKYYRPTIVLAIDREKGIAKGSARSIEGFHLFNELAKNREILPHFGGHPMAAGMTLGLEHVDELRTRLNAQAKQCLTDDQLVPKVKIDVPVELGEITVQAIEEIQKLGPFGTEFAKPIFAIQNVSIKSMRKIGSGENHLKAELEDMSGTVDAVGFSKGHLADEIAPGVKASFIGDLQINEWQGNKKPQFMMSDVLVEEWQLFDVRGKSKAMKWYEKVPENTSFIAFKEETISAYTSIINKEILLVSDETTIQVEPNVVLLDMPPTAQIIEKIIAHIEIERIYTHFYMPDSQYFNGMPSRDHFKWYYSFLKKRPAFDLNQHIRALSGHIGLNIDVINFMTKVFSELGFVTIENGLTTVVENAPKSNLNEANAYKMREQQIELEQKLLYATYRELKQWFDERLSSQGGNLDGFKTIRNDSRKLAEARN
jgi:single-stranded-DNA-specific exonuclease